MFPIDINGVIFFVLFPIRKINSRRPLARLRFGRSWSACSTPGPHETEVNPFPFGEGILLRCCLFRFRDCVYKIYTWVSLKIGKPSQETPTLPKTENLLDSRGPPFFRSKLFVLGRVNHKLLVLRIGIWRPSQRNSSWWLNQPLVKNMLVKMGSSSPIFGVKIKKYLSCHHLDFQSHKNS